MKKLSLIIAAVFVFGVANTVNAKSGDESEPNKAQHQVTIGIETHALIGVGTIGEGSTAISLSPEAPEIAGNGLDFSNATNSDLRLRYSSIVSSNDAKNSISAKIEGSLPAGVKLLLEVGECTTGTENVGSPVDGAVELSNNGSGDIVVSGIGSSYTGSEGTQGHPLTYSLVENFSGSTDYGSLVVTSTPITVVYTITEN